jgi:RNA polymerase sigma-70 factor, ECF subfamily
VAAGEVVRSEISVILAELQRGDVDARKATDRLFEIVLGEIRRQASNLMRAERAGHTLQPSALVNEVYLRLVGKECGPWQNRAHFLGVAARAMRQILVEHARRRVAAKRGGAWQRVTLDEGLGLGRVPEVPILDLERALTRLAAMDARMAEVAELRVVGGMTVQEVAHHLGISVRTVHNDWRVAKMWLARELAGQSLG